MARTKRMPPVAAMSRRNLRFIPDQTPLARLRSRQLAHAVRLFVDRRRDMVRAGDAEGRILGQCWRALGKRTVNLAPLPAVLSQISAPPDRKSTRLNSSHLGISYAVF